jgi:hypothetical protein
VVPRFARWVAYGVVVGLFTWLVSFYYIPGKGFTYLIEFGALNTDQLLPEIKAVNHYEVPNSGGYDGQWYAQIAVHPNLGDLAAMNAPGYTLRYRARRILFEWTAWLIGGGNPIRVMNVYALQNIVCWYLLAALLLRWFPPVSWGNWFRWTAMLFSFGVIFSVRCALLDGPALLLVAAAMALAEKNRPWMGALVMGIAGLGKDTSVIGAAALEPPIGPGRQAWGRWICGAALVIGPVALWAVCLRLWVGPGNTVGVRNFAGPFAGLTRKILGVLSSAATEPLAITSVSWLDLLALAGLLAQFFFFALRIRPRDPWWRLGIAYAVLLAFLGDAVWQGYPTAAARVLLPMTFAFNVAVPRRGAWAFLLVLGNIGLLPSAQLALFSLPEVGPHPCYVVEGTSELRYSAHDNDDVRVSFLADGWWMPEAERMHGKKTEDYWRWSKGDGSVALHNPHSFALVADLTFGFATVNDRHVTVKTGTVVLWQGALKPANDNPAAIVGLVLPPGDTVLEFHSDLPPVRASASDARLFAFSLRDLKILLKSRR